MIHMSMRLPDSCDDAALYAFLAYVHLLRRLVGYRSPPALLFILLVPLVSRSRCSAQHPVSMVGRWVSTNPTKALASRFLEFSRLSLSLATRREHPCLLVARLSLKTRITTPK
ncbi:hypothetical protein BJ508DRAFT_64945 [Ascobolus immersus RN42]|uniref:Uncharacterized protein n=1 Tax=Ascobolus immersus RN42 TaxID=1160509 RepID=A0A3N4IUA3_ASCIM|nr:hypothetical protein BJ508DRAFT_64945 [Ascobolus immersus RN42]